MNSDQSRDLDETCVEVDYYLAWDIYHRLHDLGISCHKNSYEPLQVSLTTPLAFVQTWSVCIQHMQPQDVMVSWLNHCWSCSIRDPHFEQHAGAERSD